MLQQGQSLGKNEGPFRQNRNIPYFYATNFALSGTKKYL